MIRMDSRVSHRPDRATAPLALGVECLLFLSATACYKRIVLIRGRVPHVRNSLMETRDSLRRVPQTVVSLLELINQAIHIHRALHKQSVKVTCDALKFDQIGLR